MGSTSRHRPLLPKALATKQPELPALRPELPVASSDVAAPATFNAAVLLALNLFSGPYSLANGLTAKLRKRGWSSRRRSSGFGWTPPCPR